MASLANTFVGIALLALAPAWGFGQKPLAVRTQ
jgi:hypothetical protein